jgi:hypothetical protein
MPRPYLSVAQLAAVTPWTPKAIARLVARGVLVWGVHYFTLPGAGRRKLIFKWDAIVHLIEGDACARVPTPPRKDPLNHAPLSDIEIRETEAVLERLLARDASGETAVPLSRARRRSSRLQHGAS